MRFSSISAPSALRLQLMAALGCGQYLMHTHFLVLSLLTQPAASHRVQQPVASQSRSWRLRTALAYKLQIQLFADAVAPMKSSHSQSWKHRGQQYLSRNSSRLLLSSHCEHQDCVGWVNMVITRLLVFVTLLVAVT